MRNDDQCEIIVDQFYDAICEVEKKVKHAAVRLSLSKDTKPWEWELAGTYIIANSSGTYGLAASWLRLARYTAPPSEGINTSQIHGFLPIYQKSYENRTFYDTFTKILNSWNVVKETAVYNRNNLIELCESDQLDGLTTTRLGVTANAKHILDFCRTAQVRVITCQAVVSQSGLGPARLKLIAGQLEELFISII